MAEIVEEELPVPESPGQGGQGVVGGKAGFLRSGRQAEQFAERFVFAVQIEAIEGRGQEGA